MEHLSYSGIAVPASSAHPAVFRRPLAAAGLRCILDFLREEDAATAQKILAEPPMYREGYAAHQIDVHPGQLDYLEETHGIKVGGAAGSADTDEERWREVSRAARACLDWAMRKEREGDSPDAVLYEEIRCLNC